MSEKKQRFGRYLILDHLVNGGMAKICRARYLGEQADKIVAIKMVQQQYSQDESFKTMFMDEIKVTFGLLHPNIVQTYDYGLNEGQLYVAMEYCDGKNLKQYLDKLKEKKFVFPVEISIYIATQAAQGLHYAHTHTDKLSGQDTGIVHRDISPHNIMLTYDGAVKVIDFGIAKANTNSEATQAGTIKGKLSYLAPEYLEGDELDHRYDQFAIGVTLWEMLCSRKLFTAKNDLAVLKIIQKCNIPAPSSINPNVPKALDEIVLKALSKNRDDRYENMDQLNRALIKFLYATYPDFNSSDLSYFAKALFKEDIQKDREKLFEFGKIDILPYLEELRQEKSNGTSNSSGANNSKNPKKKIVKEFDFGFEQSDATATSRVRSQLRKKKNAPRVDIKKMEEESEQVQNMKVEKTQFHNKRDFTQTRSRVSQQELTRSQIKREEIESVEKKSGGILKYVAMCALVVGAGYFGQDFLKKTNTAKVKKETAIVADKQEAKNEVTMFAKVRLDNYSKYKQKLFVDGKREKVDYLKNVKVVAKKEITIRVESPGRKHFIKKMILKPNEEKSIMIPDDLAYESFGYLTMSRQCLYGTLKFSLYGEERREVLPIKSRFGIAFPINGDGRTPADEDSYANYTLYYKKDGESLDRRVKIKFENDEERIDFCEYLE